MELKKFWKYLAIGMIIAVVFGITLNVGWETVFITFILGFGTAIGKGMRKDYEMKYAFLRPTFTRWKSVPELGLSVSLQTLQVRE